MTPARLRGEAPINYAPPLTEPILPLPALVGETKRDGRYERRARKFRLLLPQPRFFEVPGHPSCDSTYGPARSEGAGT